MTPVVVTGSSTGQGFEFVLNPTSDGYPTELVLAPSASYRVLAPAEFPPPNPKPAYATSYDTVASAATVTLPDDEPVVSITGTTTVTSVTAKPAGSRVTLIFAGILTFTDGSNLKLAGNFVTTADDAITLVSDGTNWVEVARSVN